MADESITVTAISPSGLEHVRTFLPHSIPGDEPVTLTAQMQADAYIEARRKAGCFIQIQHTPAPDRSDR